MSTEPQFILARPDPVAYRRHPDVAARAQSGLHKQLLLRDSARTKREKEAKVRLATRKVQAVVKLVGQFAAP